MLSIVVPSYNEAENLAEFCRQTFQVVKRITPEFEVIIVDDGSTDNSWEKLRQLKRRYPRLKLIRLRRQSGQTACLMTGFKQAQGEIIITIDADLQHDPQDIARLLKALDNNTDVVSGSRTIKNRPAINQLISRVEFWLVRWFLGIELDDSGVAPNAYRREVMADIHLFGEMHRYLIPILAWRGFVIKTIPVAIRPRTAGVSKYKTSKAIKGFLDLLIIKFWQDFSTKPIHVFGSLGLFLMAVGGILGAEEAVKKLVFGISIIKSTIPLLAAFLAIVGIQFVVFGVLADIMIKTYYKDNDHHQIREKIL